MPDRPPSLVTMQEALDLLLPSSCWRPKKTVIVAGTNGKGSVCATLETLFIAAGETVGLYTSPHLEETTERIRINGAHLSEEQFCQIYSEVKSLLPGMKLTHFEILTLMAAWAFFSGRTHTPVDRAIFEVGLGGTWDATNAIPHDHCIITQLGYDHQNLLGNSLTEIAKNKFGIIQKNALVVHSPLPDEVQSLATETQEATGSTWIPSSSIIERVEIHGREPIFYIETPWGEAKLALPGRRGAENTATALTYFKECGYNPSLFLSRISEVQWKGRMEKWTGSASRCAVYLSGDHNPQGVKSLTELLPHYWRNHLYILVGVGRDKSRDEILSPLFSLPNTSIFLTETPFKGLKIQDYGQWKDLAKGTNEDPAEAIQSIFDLASEEDLILVTGSLYLVGYIKSVLKALSPSKEMT